MNQKSFKIVLSVVAAILLGAVLYFVLSTEPATQNNQNTDNSVPAANGNNQDQTPQPDVKSSVYETQYLKITVPKGWTAKQASQTIYDNNNPVTKPNPAAVNITKGNYILYINTQAGQASGVEGGRFGEISSGAPSADAVVTEQPSPPCGTSEAVPAFLDFKRVDLYVSAKDKQGFCSVPTNGATVWYFSYLTTKQGGYFNYYKPGETPALVVTMAYNSKVVNNLPTKGSSELKTALDDMTKIVQSLQVK